VLAASIVGAMMMEAAITSKKSLNLYETTRRNNPEDSHIHTPYHENLKSHYVFSHCREVELHIYRFKTNYLLLIFLPL
jgi:hypothetical protein